MDKIMEPYKDIPCKSAKRRKTMRIIDDDVAVPDNSVNTSVTEEPVLYQRPGAPLDDAAFRQMLTSILNE